MSLSRAELEKLTATDIATTIAASDLDFALRSPPFIQAGLLNLRDLGLVPGSAIRPGLVYRSARLANDEATRVWVSSTVRTVFDLRGETEAAQHPDPVIEGVKGVRFAPESMPPRIELARFDEGDGSQEWGRQYLTVATLYRPAIRAVLEHVRDRPGEPFLIHCTAGRDRTGVVSGILHSLAGTPSEDIEFDYVLTRVGLEPGRAQLEALLQQHWKIEHADSTPGWNNFASLRPTYWRAFVQLIEDKFGGFEEFVRAHLGFKAADVEVIKRNLRDPAETAAVA